MPADLPALAARLREAREGDRETDAEIAEFFGHKITWRSAGLTMESTPVIHWQAPHPYAGMREPCPFFTSSLDAAVALVRAVEPDFTWTIDSAGYDNGVWQDGKAGAFLFGPWSSGHPSSKAFAPTPALALCLALVEWRIAHP